jgi:hypothetical protein
MRLILKYRQEIISSLTFFNTHRVHLADEPTAFLLLIPTILCAAPLATSAPPPKLEQKEQPEVTPFASAPCDANGAVYLPSQRRERRRSKKVRKSAKGAATRTKLWCPPFAL